MGLNAYLQAVILIWTGMAAKRVLPPCDQDMFDSNVHKCLSDFNKSMESSRYQESCPWATVKSWYTKLTFCVDDCVRVSSCKGHGFLVDKVFLRVHQTYFSHCGHFRDPPLAILIMLLGSVIIATLALPFVCTHIITCEMEAPCSLGLWN